MYRMWLLLVKIDQNNCSILSQNRQGGSRFTAKRMYAKLQRNVRSIIKEITFAA